MVTYPLETQSGSYYNIIANLLRILDPLVDDLFIITANFPEWRINKNVKLINFKHASKGSFVSKALSNLIIQIRISYALIKNFENIGDRVFILSGTLLLPTLVARILRKKPILTALASESKNAMYKPHTKYTIIIKILEALTLWLSYKIIVEYPPVAMFMGIDTKYKKKILPKGPLFIYDKNAKSMDPVSVRSDRTRRKLIGYIGRLSEEKGVLNFLRAIPSVLLERNDFKFIFIGDGPLRDEIETYIKYNDLTDNVILQDWVPHDKIPYFLREIRLLILPSYTEGLPNILLEAMACGTPVLATPVGAIPGVIIDGKTGFIMENNSSESIAANIIRISEHPDTEGIAQRAQALVEHEFAFDTILQTWRGILEHS